ncbi:MAG TPA: helix-turn-helix domain-containing protein [Pirellulales bacterium]
MAIAQRRRQVADLYLQRWTQSSIAERVGVDQSTVCDDLKYVRREWRDSAVRDFDLAQAEELQKLDRVEREAWAAWEQSQKPAQSAVINGDGGNQQTRKSVRNRHGDPRMLEIILKCNAARRTMLGLDAPTKIAPVMPNGQEPYRLAVATLSVIELRALKRVRDRQLALTQGTETKDDDQTIADDRID